MIGLIMVALKFLPNVLGFLQSKDQGKREAQALDTQYQVAFIQATSDLETRVVRNLIVVAFAIALFSPTWGAILKVNAAAMPVYGWFFLVWEFIGKDALYVLPWFQGYKGSGGNGNGNPFKDLVPKSELPDTNGGGTVLEPARVDNPDHGKN